MLSLRVGARAPQFSQREIRLSVSMQEWSTNVAIMAIFDATKPADTRFRVNILSAIQPAVVCGALHGVYAGFVNGVRVARHPKEHVISGG